MRYLLLFFVFIFHSHFVFAQTSDGGGGSGPTCASKGPEKSEYASNIGHFATLCMNQNTSSNKRSFVTLGPGSPIANQPTTKFRCDSQCTCPPPSYYSVVAGAGGIPSALCIQPTEGEPPENLCPSGYPRVNGQCPVCIGGQNPDGTCVDDSGGASSGANASSPTSSPDSGSSGSTASGGGGGDDNPNTPGGGGGSGGNGGGGNNNGGGSAGASSGANSSSSWVNHAGYGNWIPVAANSNCPNKFQDQSGQWWCAGGNSNNFGSSVPSMPFDGPCNPTAHDYFACINTVSFSNTSSGSGSNSSWTPISGYGNWIPVGEDSPCPNKFKDAQGKWWCAGGATVGGGGGGGGTGTASSGGAAGSSPAGECDSTSRDYLECISTGKASSRSASSVSSSAASASSNSSRSGTFSSLGEKGSFDGEASEKQLADLEQELTKKIADIKADINGEFGGAVSGIGTIQDFCKNIRGNEVCFGLKKFEPYLDPISQAIFLVACFLSFAIVLKR